MLPSIPRLEDYDISPHTGFLPSQPPLEILPDPYYVKWEAIVKHLQALLLSKRLKEVIQELPVITTSRLRSPAEWRRAYVLLAFMSHAYIWGGDQPEERVPPSISIPFKQVCHHLELPTVATYAGVCLWNWKPIFEGEPVDSLSNLSSLVTFTGSLDESWFYLVSIAIEARAAPLLPLMLDAVAAARVADVPTVTSALHTFAERLDEVSSILQRMYDNCDPHVFYHRIRPFLAGSKNMADTGLPNGVLFDTGSGTDSFVQLSGGSNAESSLIQFFDIIIGVEHRPTGTRARTSSRADEQPPPTTNNFIHDMRNYMPGPHRRFLAHLASVANIRPFVESHAEDKNLTVAYDAAVAMLRAMRDKHMHMVSRYIVIKSREASTSRTLSPTRSPAPGPPPRSISFSPTSATSTSTKQNIPSPIQRNGLGKKQVGTGGTSLIPFLKQARDETGEAAVGDWFAKAMARSRTNLSSDVGHADSASVSVVGLAEVWRMDETEGGICHW